MTTYDTLNLQECEAQFRDAVQRTALMGESITPAVVLQQFARVKTVFGTIADAVSDKFKSDKPVSICQLSPMQEYRIRDLDALVAKVQYTDIMPLTAYRPTGCVVGWHELAMALSICVTHCYTLQDKFVNPFEHFLAGLHDSSKGVSVFGSRINFDLINQSRKKAEKAINPCYGKEVKEYLTVANVIQSKQQWVQTDQLIKEMIHQIDQVDRRTLLRSVKAIEAHVDALQTEDSSAYSRRAIDDIVTGCDCLIAELDFYVITHYRLQQLLGSIQNTKDNIDHVAKLAKSR